MDLVTCLENVVGLTDKECDCFPVPTVEGDPIVDPAESLSGLYVDDSEDGINFIFPANARDCGDGDSVFDVMIKARKEAINDFITEFGSYLTEYTLPRHAEAISAIGEIEKKKNVPLATSMEDYIGTMVRSKRVRGATMYVPRIRVRASGDLVNSTLNILSSEDNFVVPIIDPIPFSAPSGVLTEIVIPELLLVPMTNPFGERIEYAFLYERQGVNPYNYRLTCGCTSKPKPAWSRYSEVVGLSVPAFMDIPDYCKETNKSYGLIIDTKMTCKSLDWLCRSMTDEDWKQNPYFRVVAKVIQLMTINKTIGFILNSTKINRYTIVKTEFLYGKRNHNRKEIQNRLAWLSQNIPADVVDCYSCKTDRKSYRGEILV